MALPQSLPAQLYLLGCSLARDTPPNGIAAPHLLRAAALAELRLAGVLATPGELSTAAGDLKADVGVVDVGAAGVGVAGKAAPADPVLAAVAAEVAQAGKPRSWTWWVRHGERDTAAAVRDQLVACGAIELTRGKVLGIFTSTRVRVADRPGVERLRMDLVDALTGSVPVNKLDPRLVALAALAAAAEMRSVYGRGVLKDARDRLAAITAAAGPVPAALRKVVRDKKVAAGAAGSSAATISATTSSS